MSRLRRVAVGALAGGLVLGGPALGATKTTKTTKTTAAASSEGAASKKPASSTPTTSAVPGDRIRADAGLVVPQKVLMRRAINRTESVSVRATLRLSDVPDPLGFTGTIDPQNDVASLTSSFQKEHVRIRTLGEDAYFEVAKVDKATYLADWFTVPLTSSSVPALVRLAHTVLLRPKLLQSVSSWKDVSTAADKAAKLRRYHGTGTLASLTLGDATGFKSGVSVTIWLDRDQFVTRLDWEIFGDKSADSQGVTATQRYTKAAPLSPTKPGGRIADYEKVVASEEADTTTDAAADGESVDTTA